MSKAFKKLFIGGNWKCNNTLQQSKDLVDKVVNNLKFDEKKVGNTTFSHVSGGSSTTSSFLFEQMSLWPQSSFTCLMSSTLSKTKSRLPPKTSQRLLLVPIPARLRKKSFFAIINPISSALNRLRTSVSTGPFLVTQREEHTTARLTRSIEYVKISNLQNIDRSPEDQARYQHKLERHPLYWRNPSRKRVWLNNEGHRQATF